MLSAANICFNRRFSFSSALVCEIIDALYSHTSPANCKTRPCSRQSSATRTPPSVLRRIASIWGSLYLVIFLRISSCILSRKFNLCRPLSSGGVYPLSRCGLDSRAPPLWWRPRCFRRPSGNSARWDEDFTRAPDQDGWEHTQADKRLSEVIARVGLGSLRSYRARTSMPRPPPGMGRRENMSGKGICLGPR